MGLPSGAASWLKVVVGFASGGSASPFCRHADTDAAIATVRTILTIIFMARAPIRRRHLLYGDLWSLVVWSLVALPNAPGDQRQTQTDQRLPTKGERLTTNDYCGHFMSTSSWLESVISAHRDGGQSFRGGALFRNHWRRRPSAGSRLTRKRRSNHACRPQSSLEFSQIPTTAERGIDEPIPLS